MVTLRGDVFVPPMGMERLRNEVAAINFVRRNTCIPVPTVRASFEDNGRYYVITDGVPGVPMSKLSPDQNAIVIKELQGYLEILHAITSKQMGGILGHACLPWRLAMALPLDAGERIKFNHTTEYEYILCHNDLHQSNILVDEETLKISAILDWEYAGFYPKEFEGAFYQRRGPAGAMRGEVNDVSSLLSILDRCTEGSLTDN
jgi:tRNA A-37 threonylcarbamoyl transferase component Bud32